MDFDSVLEELAIRAGRRIASNYRRDFESSFDLISERPGIGVPRPKFGKSIRLFVVHPYLILYEGTPKAEDVLVLRILHGRRHVTRKLIDEGRNGQDR